MKGTSYQKDLQSANRNITKITNIVSFWVWTMKINLEREKKTRELSIYFTHPSIKTYEQEQIVQVALKFTGPKPDQQVLTEFVTLRLSEKSPWNRAPASPFPPHQSPKINYQFQ